MLEESGVWDGRRFEMIDGELYEKMGKKRPHVIASTIIRAWLEQKFGWEFIDVEASLDVAPEDNPRNEPEPDLVVLWKPTWELTANPLPRPSQAELRKRPPVFFQFIDSVAKRRDLMLSGEIHGGGQRRLAKLRGPAQ